MLLLICELFKAIIVIMKQFSLAALTLRISSLSPSLGLITFLSVVAAEVMGKAEHGRWRNRSVLGPAHLASLHTAAGMCLSSRTDNFNCCLSALLARWPACRVPGKFQNVAVNEDPLPVNPFQVSSHSINPQPWAQVSHYAWYQAASQALYSSPEPSPLLLPLGYFLLYLFYTTHVGKRLNPGGRAYLNQTRAPPPPLVPWQTFPYFVLCFPIGKGWCHQC